MPDQLRLTVHFTDGTKIDAQAPGHTGDPAAMTRNVRKAMDADKPMLELDGQLLMIPLANVKYVQVSPSPESLPDGVLTGASLIS